MNEQHKDDGACADYRTEFAMCCDDPEAIARLTHQNDCVGCRAWTNQMESLVEYVAQVPQFDVSEAITQRVLASVQNERKIRVAREWIFLPAALVIGTAVFFVAPIDSMEGGCSWLLCATLAAAFGVIARGANQANTEVRS